MTPVSPPSLREAVAAIQAGDESRAAQILEIHAMRDDSRAQYLLGALYFTGKTLPANKPLGYAWLELAADASGQYSDWSAKKAVEMMVKVQPIMTARNLVEADLLVPALKAGIEAANTEQARPALDRYTSAAARVDGGLVRFDAPEVGIRVPDAPSSDPLLRLGCANVEHTDCPAHRDAEAGEHCTGRIVQATTRPSIRGGIAKIVAPSFPVGAMRDGNAGRALVLAHVDATGWVCSVTLVESSSEPSLDRSAVDAARQWRLNPASASGKPVESLYLFGIEYTLSN